MKDRLKARRLAKDEATKEEFISDFYLRWDLVEAIESDAEPSDWKTPGNKCYVFTKSYNFCLLASASDVVREWDAYRDWKRADRLIYN